jgi:hypothetical protein
MRGHISLQESPMSFQNQTVIYDILFRAAADVTEAELVEIVPDLRALASVETSAEVRAALIRLANRYAAMALDCRNLARSTMVFESAA